MHQSLDQEWYRRTLDSLLEGFQILGFDWTYLYVNAAAAAHGRRSPDELEGRKIWEAYPGIENTPLFATLKTCMDERRHVALENLFTYPDGAETWFELRVEPVPQGLCIHSVNIQERKTAQAALEKLNSDLETRVAVRTRELQQLNSELEAFTYSVSHDLRAPVRHVAGFASLLKRLPDATLGAKGEDYLAKISDAAARMDGLIGDLLALSRTGRAPLDKRHLGLEDCVREARRELPESAARAEWIIGPLHSVYADPNLLRLVFVNLLSNALKYTRTSEQPRIEIASHIDGGTGEVVVSVRDNGVGFDMKYVDKLFGVFQRLHRAEDFEGTGIGLANVRRIIYKHGGRTWAEGQVNGGATFYFSLPTQGV